MPGEEAGRGRGRGSGTFSRKAFLTPCRSSFFCHSPAPHGSGHRRRNHRLLINRRSEDIRTPPHPATRKREARPSSSCRLCNLGTASISGGSKPAARHTASIRGRNDTFQRFQTPSLHIHRISAGNTRADTAPAVGLNRASRVGQIEQQQQVQRCVRMRWQDASMCRLPAEPVRARSSESQTIWPAVFEDQGCHGQALSDGVTATHGSQLRRA